MPTEHRSSRASLVVGVILLGVVVPPVVRSATTVASVSVFDPAFRIVESPARVDTAGVEAPKSRLRPTGQIVERPAPAVIAGVEAPKSRLIDARNVFHSAATTGARSGPAQPNGLLADDHPALLDHVGSVVKVPDGLVVVPAPGAASPRPGCPEEPTGPGPAVFEEPEAGDSSATRPLRVYEWLRCAKDVTLTVSRLCRCWNGPTYRIK